MDHDLKREWIDALRSGGYRQCRFRLRNTSGEFCAMGVLADLLVQRGEATWHVSLYGGEPYLRDDINGYGGAAALPPRLADVAGIDSRTERVVANLNDGTNPAGTDGRDFDEIADWIKQHAPEGTD